MIIFASTQAIIFFLAKTLSIKYINQVLIYNNFYIILILLYRKKKNVKFFYYIFFLLYIFFIYLIINNNSICANISSDSLNKIILIAMRQYKSTYS